MVEAPGYLFFNRVATGGDVFEATEDDGGINLFKTNVKPKYIPRLCIVFIHYLYFLIVINICMINIRLHLFLQEIRILCRIKIKLFTSSFNRLLPIGSKSIIE
jgi:hypothetical protein